MATELQGLLDEIKKNGIDKAEAEAKSIIEKARKEAEEITAKAESESKALRENAEKKAQETEEYGRTALTQAARDIILSVSESLQAIARKLAETDTKDAMSSDDFCKVIADAVKAYAESSGSDGIEVLAAKEQQKAISKHIQARLSEELQKGTKISIGPSAGFRIRVEKGRVEHDFTPEAIVEAMAGYVNANLAKLLKETAASAEDK